MKQRLRKVIGRVVRGTRHATDRVDHPRLRDVRRMVRALRRDPPDVLYMGSSEIDWVAPYDKDRRALRQSVPDALGPDVKTHVIAFGGFHPEVYLEFLRLVRDHDLRPLILHPLLIRGHQLPWVVHPVFGHRSWIEELKGIDSHAPLWRFRGSKKPPDPKDFEAQAKLPYPTLLGEGTIGDWVEPLKRIGGLEPEERARMLYAYHHSGEVMESQLPTATALGRTLREMGCASVAYHISICIERGVELLGPEFEERVRSNQRRLEEAYLAGAGADSPVLQTGHIFGKDEFIDPDDGLEHLNDKGRKRFIEMVVEAVRPQLRPDPGQARP